MRRLILMRHSKTEATNPLGDKARHLTPRGVQEAQEAGRAGEVPVGALIVAPAFAGVVGGVGRGVAQASMAAVACGAAGLLGAVRWQTAKPVDFGVPMMATAAGALPPTLVLNLVRGFDVATLIVAPVLLNVDPIWSLALAVVVALFLRSGLNTDELTEQAKEQREQLDAERAKRGN